MNAVKNTQLKRCRTKWCQSYDVERHCNEDFGKDPKTDEQKKIGKNCGLTRCNVCDSFGDAKRWWVKKENKPKDAN